jgi:hypothetical protein
MNSLDRSSASSSRRVGIKLCCGSQTKRIMRMPLSYEDLLETTKKTFRQLSNEQFDICYFDDEGDIIEVTDNDDYLAAYDFHAEASVLDKKSLKFYARLPDQDLRQSAFGGSILASSRGSVMGSQYTYSRAST